MVGCRVKLDAHRNLGENNREVVDKGYACGEFPWRELLVESEMTVHCGTVGLAFLAVQLLRCPLQSYHGRDGYCCDGHLAIDSDYGIGCHCCFGCS